MDPVNKIEFCVDEQYENEKGVFTVISIHRDKMVIRWENGEEIETEISFQRRIQLRRMREKIAEEIKAAGVQKGSGKSSGAKTQTGFNGFQPGDFKKTASRTNWRSRNRLGSAVTKRLPQTRRTFNSWAFANKPELHWCDVKHRSRDQAEFQTRFFARLNQKELIYGFCFPLPRDPNNLSLEQKAFNEWLMQPENDQRLQTLAIDNELAIYDCARPSFGGLRPYKNGWSNEDGKKQQTMDVLASYLESMPSVDGIGLEFVKEIPKIEALDRGKDIAEDIAELFTRLMPLYENAIR